MLVKTLLNWVRAVNVFQFSTFSQFVIFVFLFAFSMTFLCIHLVYQSCAYLCFSIN
jgi:hypothetical protein